MCESLFPCHTSVQEIKNEALFVKTSSVGQSEPNRHGFFASLFGPTLSETYEPPPHIIKTRSTCKLAGSLCPGITIGCALCGVFAPGTCGDTCIVAGLYCGTSGYACQYEAIRNSQETETSDEETAEEVEVEETAVEEGEEETETKRRKAPKFYPFQY